MPVCTTGCGECCEQYWYQAFYIEKHPGTSCPHLQDAGCSLPRNQRPKSCNDFLCPNEECDNEVNS